MGDEQDIVERVRAEHVAELSEAADEIERLRARIVGLEAEANFWANR